MSAKSKYGIDHNKEDDTIIPGKRRGMTRLENLPWNHHARRGFRMRSHGERRDLRGAPKKGMDLNEANKILVELEMLKANPRRKIR